MGRGRVRQAREQLAKDGPTFTDDRGNLKAHPAAAIEKSAQSAFCSALRLLRLDLAGESRK